MSVADAQEFLHTYLNEVCRVDVPRVNGIQHNPENVRRTLASLARHSASNTALATIAADVGGERPVEHRTIVGYLDALARVFVSEDQPAWAPHMKSKSTLRSTPKRHLVDPSLAVAAMGASAERIFADRKAFGCLFESLVVRDLRVYGQSNDSEVFFYRDNTGLEADAIIQRRDGVWMAIEVKLGGSGAVDEAAESLLRLRHRIDEKRMGHPAKLLVVTSTGSAYERSDGVAVVPVTLLGP